ncbi:uncharacterized protein EI90DRAFT_3117944 [Cantharellus anzutake]|uniref:uncharacterized protein n=1 Tax=Cantharellus anzutake TaxID=1750568 RepID=UPI001904EF29|nr:uncharacterized protein EI90DRAFT_3117944 [Cantharellus anzutake]KAF8338871.1 hypothetical protein EI90DRAFT_3117944 [Cantharellus anzutake]
MAASPPKIPGTRQDLLEPGLACLVCRQKKTKCDGVRPTCGRCLRLGRPCEYAGTPRSRVKKLEEKIQNLESEIAALRSNPAPPIQDEKGTEAYASSRIPRLAILPRLEMVQELYNAEAFHVPETIPIFPISTLFSNIAFASAEEQPFPHPGEAYPKVIARVAVERALANWDIRTEMPHQLKDYLLRIFLAHRFQFHSGPLVARLLEGTRSSTHDRALHPSLTNSMYLLACHVSGSSMSSYESFFVARTRADLETPPAFVDRLVDFLVASTLLGIYFTRTRRYPEAYTTLSGAIRLAIACGLQPLTAAQHQGSAGSLPPPRDYLEMIERRHAWFALNAADRILARESGLPSSLPEDGLAEIYRSTFQDFPINGPLEASTSEWVHHQAAPNAFLNPGIFDVSREIDHVCLRAKMELLFEGIRLFRAHNMGNAEPKSVGCSKVPFWQTFNFLEASLFECQKTMSSLINTLDLGTGEYSALGFGLSIPRTRNPDGEIIVTSRPNPALFSAKVVMYAAVISLQNALLESPYVADISGEAITEARRKAVQAADGMAALLKSVISPSANMAIRGQTEAVYFPMSTVYRDLSLLVGILQRSQHPLSLRQAFQPHVLDASVVMAHEIQRPAPHMPMKSSLAGASDPSMSMDNEVKTLIGILADNIRALSDL